MWMRLKHWPRPRFRITRPRCLAKARGRLSTTTHRTARATGLSTRPRGAWAQLYAVQLLLMEGSAHTCLVSNERVCVWGARTGFAASAKANTYS